MTIEQRVAVLEEIFSKLQDYYTSAYSGEEIDARLASAGVPIGITKEYKSVAEMNQDFTGTDVARGQFVLILPDSTDSPDYGKVYLKGTANWVYAFTLTDLTAIKGPIGPPGPKGDKGNPGEAGTSFAILGYFDTLDTLKAAIPNPTASDVYGVGTAPPYNIYIWDSVHGKWVGNGNLQGPKGEQGEQGAQGPTGPRGPTGPKGDKGMAADSFTLSLPASGWSGNAQTVSHAKLAKEGYAYIMQPAGGSYGAYSAAEIYADDVTVDGKITFHCAATPTTNVTVNVLKVEVAS
nr:MAG TPA: nucleoid-associated protein [Caudoviricetes sp.]